MSEPTTVEEAFNYSGAVGEDGAFADGWQELLAKDEHYADAAKTVARFKTLPELAKGYAELNRELSKRGELPTVPGKDATPEQVAKYRTALGIPETPEGYAITKPDDLPDEMWDGAAAKVYQELFHKHNITPAAAKEIIDTYMGIEQGRADAMEAHQQGELARAHKAIQDEFGPETTKQLDLARRMALTAGVDPNDPAFNSPAVVKALAFAGRNMSEDRMVSSGSSPGVNSSSARANDIQTNPSNPLYARYQAGEEDAVNMVRRLIQGKI